MCNGYVTSINTTTNLELTWGTSILWVEGLMSSYFLPVTNINKEFMPADGMRPVVIIPEKMLYIKMFSNNTSELLVIALNRLYFVLAKNLASG